MKDLALVKYQRSSIFFYQSFSFSTVSKLGGFGGSSTGMQTGQTFGVTPSVSNYSNYNLNPDE